MPSDKRKNIKQISVCATIAEVIKICCDSRGERLQRQHFGCAESVSEAAKSVSLPASGSP